MPSYPPRKQSLHKKYIIQLSVILFIFLGLFVLAVYFFGTYNPDEERISDEPKQVNIKQLQQERKVLFDELNTIVQVNFQEAVYQMEPPNASPDTAVLQFTKTRTQLNDWQERFADHIVLEEGYSEASQNKYLLLGNELSVIVNKYSTLAKLSSNAIKEGIPYPDYMNQSLGYVSVSNLNELQEDLQVTEELFTAFDKSFPKNNF